jgi:hypothetical protein
MSGQQMQNNLEIAILNTDSLLLESLISQGVNINERCINNIVGGMEYKIYPLCFAIKNKNIQMVRRLILAGANFSSPHRHFDEDQLNRIERPDCVGGSLMKLICENDDAFLMELLLQKGFDPDLIIIYLTPNILGSCLIQYPLTMAVGSSATEVSRTLVKYGADPNKRFISNNPENQMVHSSLYLAMRSSWETRYSLATLFLENNADPNLEIITKKERQSPLEKAALSADIRMIFLLLKYGAKMDEKIIQILTKQKKPFEEMMKCKSENIISALKYEFSVNNLEYYETETKKAISVTYTCLRKKFINLKKEVVLYLMNFMI